MSTIFRSHNLDNRERAYVLETISPVTSSRCSAAALWDAMKLLVSIGRVFKGLGL